MSPTDLPSVVAPVPRRVPEAYLRAEIAAFPLTSEKSFRTSLLKLDPLLGENGPTRHLWRACEDMLAQHTGWSLDRLVSARDRGWFGQIDVRRSVSMCEYLRALARSHLVPRAGVTQIKEGADVAALDAANHYRWLTFTMPEDLLLAALGVEPAPVHVDIDPPLLIRRLIDSGVAEIHQHVGAGMDFRLLWVSVLAALVSPKIGEDELASPGAPLSEGRSLVRWLLAAAIARCMLAEFLIRGGERDFWTFVLASCDPDHRPAWTPLRRRTLLETLGALATANESRLPDINQLRDLYAEIHPTALTLEDDPIRSVDDAFCRCDPIAVRLGLHGENAGERWFLREGFKYLDADNRPAPLPRLGRDDQQFAHVFWQTIRVRCQYYHAVVERPLTGGLQWFIRFYGRLGKLRNPIGPILPEASYHVAGQGRRIQAMELRTSAADTAIGIGEQVLEFLESWHRLLKGSATAGFEPELGVILHFIKGRDGQQAWSRGVPPAFWAGTFAEPDKGQADVDRGRYVRYFAAQARKARALAELITQVPSCLHVVRGLDVASDEIGVPTWVLVPLFRHVLDAAARVSIMDGAGPPLKVTAHVGEDFRHLLEGLRRIYEHIHYVQGASSGRLGHAVALGVNPRTWAESVGTVLMPAEERLWDLVWEWRLYTNYYIRQEYAAMAPQGRLGALVNQARILADLIYPNLDASIEVMAEAHHLLHRFAVPPYVLKPAVDGAPDTFRNAARNIKTYRGSGTANFQSQVGELLEQFVADEGTFRRGQTLIDVPIHGDEVAALDAVQDALRRGIAQNGIVIEVNPSSNLLIGDMLDMRNHPVLRLFPPLPVDGAPPPVAIAIGSDDPVTFSTQLMGEYTLLHQTARAAGYSERVVQRWLESIRCTGMDARFTLPWSPSAEGKIVELKAKMSRFLHKPRTG